MLLSLNWQKEREAKCIGFFYYYYLLPADSSEMACSFKAFFPDWHSSAVTCWVLVLLPTWVSSPPGCVHPCQCSRGKVRSPPLSLPLAAPGLFKLLCTCTGGVLSPGRFCLELEHCLVLQDGAAQGGDCIMGRICCCTIEFPSDQEDHWAGLSLAPGARDDPGSYCHVGSEVLACPTSFYLGKCWSQVHSSRPLSCICSTANAEPDAPVARGSLPSLLSSGGSLAPLLLSAGLWTPPLLAVFLPTRGHLPLPELVFPPSAVSGKGIRVFVALANNEAKI